MSSRLEFVTLALAPGANIRELCRRIGISPKTGYKMLARFQEQGVDGLADRSRRPLTSPGRTVAEVESYVLALHAQYPCWGARKLHGLIPDCPERPHFNTIDAILKRHGKQVLPVSNSGKPAKSRFEYAEPNQLWQMDFKGHFALTNPQAGRCHPLTVLDDHSRFALCLTACSQETGAVVQAALTVAFRRYGLPERITCDNGSPWRNKRGESISKLEVWLLRHGIRVSHSRPHHPQTQGKDERFHRTLKYELTNRFGYSSIASCQSAFDEWRDQYNIIRPHAALGQKPPISRFTPSARQFPNRLPAVEYATGKVLKVRKSGQIRYDSRDIFVGEGLAGELVALRPTAIDGQLTVYFCDKEIRVVDLRNPP